MRTQGETGLVQMGKKAVPHQDPDTLAPSSRDFQPPELGEINVHCFSHLLCGVPLRQPEVTTVACHIIIFFNSYRNYSYHYFRKEEN